MQIILQEDVEKLGTRGEVVEVAAGYARNYLLPQKLALEASPANIKRLEKIRITLSKRTATEKDAAEQQAALLNQSDREVRAQGRRDRPVVRLRDVRRSGGCSEGARLRDRQAPHPALDEPIKIVGESLVTVKLVHGVTAEFKVVVEKEA